MSIGKVSFGRVVAVSGKPKNMKKFDNEMKRHQFYKCGKIMQKDVTSHYKNAASSGLMAQSAQSGQPVEIYITGNDVQKVLGREEGWDTLDGILSKLAVYMSIDGLRPDVAVEKVVNS